MTKNGFTLAELLLALVILGVIATFTIPKVLNSQSDSKRISVLKETISALSEATYLGTKSGDLNPNNVHTYYLDKLNSVRKCPTRVDTEGCWPVAVPMPFPTDADEPGIVMHNGAWLGGFSSEGDNIEHVSIDWNGANPPNLEGDDQLAVRLVFGPNGGDKPGTVVAKPDQAASVTLFNEVFSK